MGPLQFNDDNATYFEIEVAELEASRTQTVAVGVCMQMPAPEIKIFVNYQIIEVVSGQQKNLEFFACGITKVVTIYSNAL